MINMIQVKVSDREFKTGHEKQLNSALNRIKDIIPKNSRLKGQIVGKDGQYEGRIHINSRIGAFVAKAKARNLFSLIAKLQAKILRQIINWREKRASKKRYLRRKQPMMLLNDSGTE